MMSVTCRTCKHSKDMHYRPGYCLGPTCDCRRYVAGIKYPPKMTTAEFRSRLMPLSGIPKARCWGNVLDAFGVSFTPTGKGKHTWEINQLLAGGGYLIEHVRRSHAMPEIPRDHETMYTIAVFLGNPVHLAGDWIVYTRDHVICVRDGKVTDTMGQHATVTRRIESIYRVTRTTGSH